MTMQHELRIALLFPIVTASLAAARGQTNERPMGEASHSYVLPITLGSGESYRVHVPDTNDPAFWCLLQQVDTRAKMELSLKGGAAGDQAMLAKSAGALPQLTLRPKIAPAGKGAAVRAPPQPGVLIVRNTGKEPFVGYMELFGSRPFQGLHISIESPTDGEVFSGNTVDVFGTVSGGPDRVVVNDVQALVVGNRFVAFQVPMQAGRNLIEAIAHAGNETKSARVITQVRPDLKTGDDAIQLPSRKVHPREGISGTVREMAARAGEKHVHVIVQYRSATTPQEVEQYRKAGIAHLYPLPGNAWMVSIPGNALDILQAKRRVRAVLGLAPADRLSLAIRTNRVPDYALTQDHDLKLNIRFFQDVPEETAMELLRRAGVSVQSKRGMFNDWTITATLDAIADLAFEDAVRFMEEVPPHDENKNDLQRANARVDLAQAVTYSLTGFNVDVGQWDGGAVDNSHGDLTGRVTVIETAGTATVADHAVHVAGTMGGTGAQSAGAGGTANQWRGMATAIDIFSDTFLFDNLEPEEHNAAITIWNIDLSQNSWGLSGSFGNYTQRASKYDNVVKGTYGTRIPIVFAAGNSQTGTATGYQTLTPPGATAKNVLVVGAIESDTSNMTAFSSFGPTDDGRLKPDVVAPGDRQGNTAGVISTIPLNNDDDSLQNNHPGAPTAPSDGLDDYFFPYNNQNAGAGEPEPTGTNHASENAWRGTSMAAPVVSGIVALMLEQYRWTEARDTGSNIRPLPSTFRAIVTNTAVDLQDNPSTAAADTTFVGPDFIYGFGQVDGMAAINMVRNQDYVESAVTTVGEVDDLNVTLPAGLASWEINLAWDDDPGDNTLPAATAKLVNDLDLVLIAPDGTRHYPWLTNGASPANAATRQIRAATDPVDLADNDHLNNNVQVTVDTPAAGIWTIRVTANVLTSTPQDYSLAVPLNFRDVFVRDRDDDDGNPVSPSPWWKSPDIWIDTTDGNPVEGAPNDVFVRVTNRGYLDVEQVHVDLYWVQYVTDLPDFDLTLAFDAPSPSWTHIGRNTLADIEPGEQRETPAFVWVGPPIPPAPDPNHFCLFAVLRSDQDGFEDAGSTDPDYLTPHNNNIAHRNVKVIEGDADDLAGQVIPIRFYLSNTDLRRAIRTDLIIDAGHLPRTGSLEVLIPQLLTLRHPLAMPVNMLLLDQERILRDARVTDSNRDFSRERAEPLQLKQAAFALTGRGVSRLRDIYLKPGAKQPVELRMTVPQNFNPGDSFEIDVMQEVNGQIVGGISYTVRARTASYPSRKR